MGGKAAVYPDEHQAAKEAEAFFAALVVPDKWKCRGPNNIRETLEDGRIWTVSRGMIFRDMSTSGFEIKDYKIVVLSASGRGAICEKTIDEERKPHYKTVISNKTITGINEYIQQNYFT